MNAIKVGDAVSLVFTTVLDELNLGIVDEDEEEEPTDRAYWEKRGTKTTVGMADELLGIVKAFDPGLELKYNKFYIGLAKNGQPNNFAVFRPQKNSLRLDLRLPRADDIQAKLEEAGLDVMEYDQKHGSYRIRLSKGGVKKHSELLTDVLQSAFDNFSG